MPSGVGQIKSYRPSTYVARDKKLLDFRNYVLSGYT